jgi:uncharacterized protein YqgV (UPF0045/DUF77 family)
MMTETAIKCKETASLLNTVYQNVRESCNAILDVMPRVKEARLKSDLTVSLSVFDAFSSRATKLLAEEGVKPSSESMMTRMTAKWNTMLQAMRDSSSAGLVDVLVASASDSVREMLRALREAENTGVSEDALRLARDLCAYQEKAISEMKEKYLR